MTPPWVGHPPFPAIGSQFRLLLLTRHRRESVVTFPVFSEMIGESPMATLRLRSGDEFRPNQNCHSCHWFVVIDGGEVRFSGILA